MLPYVLQIFSFKMSHLMIIATLGVGIIILIIKLKNIMTDMVHGALNLSFDSRFFDTKFTAISIIRIQ